jgi:hypothetical protein
MVLITSKSLLLMAQKSSLARATVTYIVKIATLLFLLRKFVAF